MKLTIVFLVLALVSPLLLLGYEVRRGERPPVDWTDLKPEAYHAGRLRIKLQPSLESVIPDQLIETAGNEPLRTGVVALDRMNEIFSVTSYKPVFSSLYQIPGKTALYRDRHRAWGFHLWFELEIDERADVIEAVRQFSQLAEIQIAEPVLRIRELSMDVNALGMALEDLTRWTPNDPRLGEQWHYHNTGANGGTPGADIDLLAAWNIEKGLSAVIVAVIDRGIDIGHPDLAGNIWPGIGYNFTVPDGVIVPGNHGTHVAGTVAALNNNSTGVSGIAGGSGANDGIRLMSCEILSSTTGYPNTGEELAPIYAADNGAAISQNSWGYIAQGYYMQSALDAIDYFNLNGGGEVLNGGITIFAAGNDDSQELWYPGCYEAVLSVAATTNTDTRTYYSNYAPWVDISAPGGETMNPVQGVLSTQNDGAYGFYMGTSMACPHVSGTAALVVSYAYRNGLVLSNSELRDILLNSTDDIYAVNPGLEGKLGSGRLNAYSALLETEDYIGGVRNPLSIQASPTSSSQINLVWTKNTNNNNVMLVYSLTNAFGVPVNGTVYNAGSTITGGGVVLARGASTSFSHTALNPHTSYYYRAFSYDSANQYSRGLSTMATTFFDGKYWTGAIDNNWNNAGNWSDNTAPDPSQNVIIPDGMTIYPSVSGQFTACKNLHIAATASLDISIANLLVYENFESHGRLILSTESSNMLVSGNIIWKSQSEVEVLDSNAGIHCKGQMTFEEGSNVQMTLGKIVFFSGGANPSVDMDGVIINKSPNTILNHVISDKTTIYQLVISSLSTEDFTINGDLRCYQNRTIRNIYNGTIQLKGNLISENTSSAGIIWVAGTLRLNGGAQSISIPHSAGYLKNLTLASSGNVTIPLNLKIKGNLLVSTSVHLIVDAQTVLVEGGYDTSGKLVLNHPNASFTVWGSITWLSGSTIEISSSQAVIYCRSSMTFNSGSNVRMLRGTVEFSGVQSAIIVNNSSLTKFFDLRLNKTAPAALSISASGTYSFEISGSVLNMQGSGFNNFSSENLYLRGNFTSLNTSSQGVIWDAGTLYLLGSSQTITLGHSTDRFMNVQVLSGTFMYLGSDIIIQGDLSYGGTINPGGYTIQIGGSWEKLTSGVFNRATSTVIFNGDGNQIIHSVSFNKLRVNKSAGGVDNKIVIGINRVVNVASFKFQAGTIEVTGGSFMVDDLEDNNVKGNYVISEGLISLTQDEVFFLDLDANLTISGGKISLNGGYNFPVDWAYTRPVSITMSGGELDFTTNSIGITNTGHALNLNITGGVIKTKGSFVNGRTGLNLGGGTIEMTGSADVTISSPGGGSLNRVKINKSSSRDGGDRDRYSKVTINQNVTISEDLEIFAGTLALNGVVANVGRDLIIGGTLEMNTAGATLNIGRDMLLGGMSNTQINHGTINITRNFTQAVSSPLTSSALNTINFVGTGDSNLTMMNPAVSLGSIGVNKSSGNVAISTSAAALNLLGNMTISPGNQFWFRTIPTVIAGALNVNGLILLQAGGSVTCLDLNMYGNITVAGALTVQRDFYQAPATQLIVSSSGNFIMDKPYTGNFMSFAGTTILNGGAITITNEGIQFGASSNLTINSGTLKIGSGLRAMVVDSFHMSTGAIEFIGPRSSSIQLAEGNYLNNVIVTKTGTGVVMLASDLLLRDLTINSGTFQLLHRTLNIAGNLNIMNGTLNAAFADDLINLNGWWNNNRSPNGFIQGLGTVAFTGFNRSVIYQSEQFNNLRINKTSAHPEGVEIETGATLSANAIEFIDGTLYLKGGATLNTPAAGLTVPYGCALRCDPLTASTINLYGDFADFNVTTDDNNGFSSGKSTINAVGSGDRNFNMSSYPMILNGLNVNLGTGICYLNSSSIVFNGNVHLQSGTLQAAMGSWTEFGQDLTSEAGTNLSVQFGALSLIGEANSSLGIQGGAEFSSLSINKTGIAANVSLTSDWVSPDWLSVSVTQGTLDLNTHSFSLTGNMNVGDGAVLEVDAGAALLMGNGNTLDIYNGGRLSVMGTSAQAALISRTGTGNYSLMVHPGGTIAAIYGIFEYMDYGGVSVSQGAFVDAAQSFTDCTFRNGISGGALLTLNNEQLITVNNAVFPANTWGGNSNVSKYSGVGGVNFVNASGAYSGSAFEYDPDSRINWGSQTPLITVGQNSLAFDNTALMMTDYRSFNISNPGSGSLIGRIIVPDDFLVSIVRAEALDSAEKALENPRTTQSDFIVLPYQSITIQVAFTPTLPIAYSSTLSIEHNAAAATQSVLLTGTGIGPKIEVDPPQIAKGILPGGYWNETLQFSNDGNTALSYYASVEYQGRDRAVILSESFESATFPPSGWSIQDMMGTAGNWLRSTATVHPSGQAPQDGQALAYFNSYTANINNHTALMTGYLDFTGYSSVNLSFWMYHDSGYPNNPDRVQIMVMNNQQWVNVGDPVLRNVAPYGEWRQHTISLSAYAGLNYVSVAFLGISEYGNDVHIDNVVINGSNPPTGWVSFNGQFSNVSGILAPGASDQHVASIYTYSMDPGVYQAQILVSTNDPVDPIKYVPIEVSVGSPAINISPSSISFGNQIVGTDATQSFSITASGGLHLNGTIAVPTGYTLELSGRDEPSISLLESASGRWSSSLEYLLAPGETQTYLVRFTPTAMQAYNGNVVITSDHLAQQTIALSGTGANVPSIQTLAATSITSTSATLNAQITSNGGLVLWGRGFRYGTDPDPITNGNDYMVAGTNNSFSAFPTGFEPGQLIYFCAFTYNELGWSYGNVLSFTTLAPTVNVSQTTLPSFGSVRITESSTPQSFTISGSDLSSQVIITALDGFRVAPGVRSDHARSPGNQMTIDPVAGSIPTTTILVYFEPNEIGAYASNISITCSEVPDHSIAVSGTGITLATVMLNGISDITQTTASSDANVTADGASPVTARGVCWSETPDPLITDAHTEDGPGSGSFVSSLTGLLPGTLYYVRAYASNQAGTAYSDESFFTTIAVPVVSASTAELPDFGNVILGESSAPQSFILAGSDLTGNVQILAPTGFQISLNDRNRERTFSSQLIISPLSGSVYETILVRFTPLNGGDHDALLTISSPGAENANVGISGRGVSLPSITTSAVTGITINSAITGGNITSTGWTDILSGGVCWGTEPNPALDGNYSSNEDLEGEFVDVLSGLQSNTLYYVRAYATNSVGTAYGNQVSFTTSLNPQLVVNSPFLTPFGKVVVGANSSVKSFSISGTELSSDVVIVSPAGFYLSLNPYTWSNETSLTLSPTGTTLSQRSIHVRFSPTSGGPASGNITINTNGVSQILLPVSGIGITLPVLTTKAATNIGNEQATSGGVITSDGWDGIISSGICYSTAPNPTITDAHLYQSLDEWDYSITMTGLIPSTQYYVRAFAVNGAGTVYADQITFTTTGMAPGIPQNLSIIIQDGNARLQWDPVPNALSYKIYRSANPLSTNWGAPVAITSNPWWVDSSGAQRYFYKVTASSDIVRD